MKTHIPYGKIFIPAQISLVLCLLSMLCHPQPVAVVSPVTRLTYKLPDPATFQSAADAQAAITTAETTGKALIADAAAEMAKTASAENDNVKAFAIQNNYTAAINAFNKNDVTPYKQDLDNYTALGTKFTGLMAKYNKAATANNALPAKDRKAATVAALNKQKMQIDTMGAHLTKWKIKLDDTKAKLDVKNAALQKQQKQYENGEQTSAAKLKAEKPILNNLLTRMTICASYATKCREILTSKFKVAAPADPGFFGSPAYRSAASDLYAYLVKLKSY